MSDEFSPLPALAWLLRGKGERDAAAVLASSKEGSATAEAGDGMIIMRWFLVDGLI